MFLRIPRIVSIGNRLSRTEIVSRVSGALLVLAATSGLSCGVLPIQAIMPATLTILSSRGTLQQAEPYNQPVLDGVANFGVATGQTRLSWLDFGHLYRFRQTGIVSQVRVAVPNKTSVTGFYVSNCRSESSTKTAPTSIDTISTSNNLADQIVSGLNTLTLATPLAVQEGDYVCGTIEWSKGATVRNLYLTPAIPTAGETAAFYSTTTTVSARAQNWVAQPSQTDQILLVEADMASPVFACTGDSILSGNPLSHSFADTSNSVTDITVPFCEIVAATARTTTQNFGHAGYMVDRIAAEFPQGPASVNPQYVILEGGTNDFAHGPLTALQIEAKWLGLLKATAAIPSEPIIIGILPLGTHNPPFATLTVLQDRDQVNKWLALQAVVYHGVFVNPDPYVGTNNDRGPAGNLWSMSAQYVTSDGLHLTRAGNVRVAQAILDALNGTPLLKK